MLPTLSAFRLSRHTCFSNPDFLETTGYCFFGANDKPLGMPITDYAGQLTNIVQYGNQAQFDEMAWGGQLPWCIGQTIMAQKSDQEHDRKTPKEVKNKNTRINRKRGYLSRKPGINQNFNVIFPSVTNFIRWTKGDTSAFAFIRYQTS